MYIKMWKKIISNKKVIVDQMSYQNEEKRLIIPYFDFLCISAFIMVICKHVMAKDCFGSEFHYLNR